MLRANPALITRWAEAWAISRGVGPPVPRHGGLYIHVGSAEQIGRYIFPRFDAVAIAALAGRVRQPLVYLKVCAPADAVRPLLSPGWEIATPGYMMTAPVAAILAGRAPSVRLDVTITRGDHVIFANVHDAAGAEIARGRIVPMGDIVVFDRIATAEPHQRRGLATAIMHALAAEAAALGIHDAMLCATPPGRALYETLGWSLHSDYTTVSLAP